MSVCRVHRA